MFDSARFLLFLTAAVLLAIAPGPGMLYVLARSLAGGKREGVLSALGTISVVMNTTADLIVISLAGPLGERIRSSASFRRRQRTVTGAIMIGLGTYLATCESR